MVAKVGSEVGIHLRPHDLMRHAATRFSLADLHHPSMRLFVQSYLGFFRYQIFRLYRSKILPMRFPSMRNTEIHVTIFTEYFEMMMVYLSCFNFPLAVVTLWVPWEGSVEPERYPIRNVSPTASLQRYAAGPTRRSLPRFFSFSICWSTARLEIPRRFPGCAVVTVSSWRIRSRIWSSVFTVLFGELSVFTESVSELFAFFRWTVTVKWQINGQKVTLSFWNVNGYQQRARSMAPI